jgi:hypothetical protein
MACVRDSFAAAYSGQLTHRGLILPSERTTIKALLRAKSPGQFSVGGWQLEVEVGMRDATILTKSAPSSAEWRILARYLQQPSGSENVILVRSVQTSN